MQADCPIAHPIEALFGDGVIDQRIVAHPLVYPDPRALHDAYDADVGEFFQRLADSKPRDAILLRQPTFRRELAGAGVIVLVDFAEQILGDEIFFFHNDDFLTHRPKGARPIPLPAALFPQA